MITVLVRLRIPGSGAWPVDEIETLSVLAREDVILQRASKQESSRILAWLNPFEGLVVAPDRLADLIAEIHSVIAPELGIVEARAAQRVTEFLRRAEFNGDYLRIVDTP
jgi:hypothetical protein